MIWNLSLPFITDLCVKSLYMFITLDLTADRWCMLVIYARRHIHIILNIYWTDSDILSVSKTQTWFCNYCLKFSARGILVVLSFVNIQNRQNAVQFTEYKNHFALYPNPMCYKYQSFNKDFKCQMFLWICFWEYNLV